MASNIQCTLCCHLEVTKLLTPLIGGVKVATGGQDNRSPTPSPKSINRSETHVVQNNAKIQFSNKVQWLAYSCVI